MQQQQQTPLQAALSGYHRQNITVWVRISSGKKTKPDVQHQGVLTRCGEHGLELNSNISLATSVITRVADQNGAILYQAKGAANSRFSLILRSMNRRWS